VTSRRDQDAWAAFEAPPPDAHLRAQLAFLREQIAVVTAGVPVWPRVVAAAGGVILGAPAAFLLSNPSCYGG
jgi:hypothetical protein